MPKLRSLIAAALLAALAGRAGAEDFWGRKIANQPTNFIFGYGSLINTTSRNATASKPIAAMPVRVAAAFGYVRCWCDRSASGFTALGLRRPKPGEDAMTVNGVLYPVEGNDMGAFDAREAGYRRVEVPREQIEAVSWQRLPEQGQIWVYVPVHGDNAPGVDLPAPSSDFPLLQSYIDVVVEGGMEYGPDYAREIIATTTDWNSYWLNDRELPRRPWVFDKQSAGVDKMLAANAPHFADRRFPEAYAVERLEQR
ncbi:MAG TPA: gamma-glutamylcyclotransferase family protein [Acetobacteraceae bacterium]|jgi:hypothetical protein|nr:gamma-glutamylcyclotransferase family protein [Acetobacteraceae bacterium]